MWKRRRVVRVVFAAAVLAGLAVVIPGSPVFLPDLLVGPGHYDGRPARHWVREAGSSDPAVRRQAVRALAAVGGELPGEAAPALAAILTTADDPADRWQAAISLYHIGPAATAAVPALGAALADSEPGVRMAAAAALHRYGAAAKPAVPDLLRAIDRDGNDDDNAGFAMTVREQIGLALGRASAGTADGVPALVDGLEGAAFPPGRRLYARALGEVGPAAVAAAPSLQWLLREEQDPETQEALRDALAKIGSAPGPDHPPDDLRLPDGERAYLWQIENHGNRLNRYGFGPLAAALKAADADALGKMLAADFAGADLGQPAVTKSTNPAAEVERLADGGRPPVPLDRAGFVGKLLGWRKLFPAAPPKVTVVMATLTPKVRGEVDGLWEGTAQLRLFGEHAPGAPAEVTALLRFETPRPTQSALAGPGWLRAASVVQSQTAKAPRYLFAEVAEARGLNAGRLHNNWGSPITHITTGGAYACDYDRDGLPDLLVTDVTGNTLYRTLPGGRFEDVTAAVGLSGSAYAPAACWADLDGDGWDDLVLGGRVYHNEGGKRFADHTAHSRLRLPADASAILPADYDRDGRLDLYVTRLARPGKRSWLDGRSADLRGNYLFRNAGGWRFEDVTKAAGALGGHRSTFTAAWLDADDDGWPDLYVPNELGDGLLLRNQQDGTFAERRLADRPADFGTMGGAAGDLDGDGRIDIYAANMYSKAGTRVIGNTRPDTYPPDVMERLRRFVAGSQLHLNKGGGAFEQAGKARGVAAVGWAYGPALADLDNDGTLDIHATAGFVSRSRDEPDG